MYYSLVNFRYDEQEFAKLSMSTTSPVNFRASKQEKRLLDQAAALLGKSRSCLIRSAALSLAREVLEMKAG